MVMYRKRSFAEAHKLLSAIQSDPSDFNALKDLHFLLIAEIIRAENKIRSLKELLKNPEYCDVPIKLTRLKNNIEKYRHLIFIWQCFGDGIAFIYIDKYALKQTFFQTDRYIEKQDSGFLANKEGLSNEIAFFLDALAHNVPAVMTDLTNTIRHGDICLLGDHDPVMIEVKSSAAGGKRSRRQKANLKKLADFLENDSAINFRGLPHVVRHEVSEAEVRYLEEINSCMDEAMECGFAYRIPEDGLQYFAVLNTHNNVHKLVKELCVEEPWLFCLNELRASRSWAPYYPFTLSIRKLENLWAFVSGRLSIYVFVGIRNLENIPAKFGFSGRFDRDDDLYPMAINHGDSCHSRLSSDFLSRIGYEFVSPNSLVSVGINGIDKEILSSKLDGKQLVDAKFLDHFMQKKIEKYGEDIGVERFVFCEEQVKD